MLLNNKETRAFSLLELLIAVAILSGSILVILQAVGVCAKITGIVNDTVAALILSEDKLQEFQYQERTKTLTQLTGSGAKGKYSWEYILELDPGLNLYKCGLNITGEEAERKELLKIETYLRK